MREKDQALFVSNHVDAKVSNWQFLFEMLYASER
jgi:hypothetical protein